MKAKISLDNPEQIMAMANRKRREKEDQTRRARLEMEYKELEECTFRWARDGACKESTCKFAWRDYG